MSLPAPQPVVPSSSLAPDPSPTPVSAEPVLRIATGFMASRYLFAASNLGLFEQLAEAPASSAELAARLRIPERTVRLLADALVALGLLEMVDDRYRNGPACAALLSGRGPVDLRPLLRYWERRSYPVWEGFERSVVTGRAAHPIEGMTDEVHAVFSAGVEAITFGSARALAAGYDFAPHRRLLDLGGGTGSFLLAALGHHPHLEGTLFELPRSARLARERLGASPVAARATVVAGDLFEDPIPAGHDVLLLANVLHLMSPERACTLLRRLRAATEEGTSLLLVDFWTDPSRTSPAFAAVMAGEFLTHAHEGGVHSEEALRGWLAQTGWRGLERIPLGGPASLVVAEA